jgi:hypothetical protein
MNMIINITRIIVIIALPMPDQVLELLGYSKRILFLLEKRVNVRIGAITVCKSRWQNVYPKVRERYFRL